MKDKIACICIFAISVSYVWAAIQTAIAGQPFPAVMCGIAAAFFGAMVVKSWPK